MLWRQYFPHKISYFWLCWKKTLKIWHYCFSLMWSGFISRLNSSCLSLFSYPLNKWLATIEKSISLMILYCNCYEDKMGSSNTTMYCALVFVVVFLLNKKVKSPSHIWRAVVKNSVCKVTWQEWAILEEEEE